MSTVANKVFIPASLSDNNQEIIISRPWYLRDKESVPVEQSPAILQFRSDSFIDDFFDSVTNSSNSEVSNTFEKLLGMRDYSEVPTAMVDVSGKGMYPHNKIIRDEAPANDVKDKDLIDEAWLRKLYLTLHEHFHLVTIDISCERQNYPRVDKKRIIDSGMVVRRLISDKKVERWEDWIPVSNEHGIWYEISDAEMTNIDPENIFTNNNCLDLEKFYIKSGTIPISCDSQVQVKTDQLSYIPKSLMPNKQYTSLFGYLSLSSELNQAPGLVSNNIEDLASKLKGIVNKKLRKRWLGDDVEQPLSELDIQQQINQRRRTLLAKIKQLADILILPKKPSEAEKNIALNFVINLDPVNKIKHLITDRFWILLSDTHFDKSLWQGSYDSWWQGVKNKPLVQNNSILSTSLIEHIQTEFLNVINQDQVKILVDFYFNELIEEYTNSNATSLPLEMHLLSLLILTRLRLQRIELLKEIYRQVLEDSTTLIAKITSTDNNIFASSLASEITAWLETDKSKYPKTWDNIKLLTTLLKEYQQAHEKAYEIESVFGNYSMQGESNGYLSFIEDRLNVLNIDINIKGVTLENLGLSKTSTCEIGFLLFPTPFFTKNTLINSISKITDKYIVNTQVAKEKRKLEASNLLNLVRPRYDSDSLYCVQCFVKIAGRNPCEKDKILWSKRTEPFSIAEPTDILGVRPVAMQLPDLKKMIRDIPRIPKARANPFASVSIPPDSDINVNPDNISDISRKMGIQMICSYGIPVFTICAWILFTIILNILLIIPGFAWLFLLKFCIPVPSKES